MSTYVLIHGSWHGAWCWEKVAPVLTREGHGVEAPDLPGHGNDRTPPAEVTLESYVERVCDALDGQSEPVILVGHSHGGIVITQTAEERPDQIATLVYLCAFLPRDGESLVQLAQRDPDPDNNVLRHVQFHEAQGYAVVSEDAVEQAFYGDCTAEDVARARSLLGPEPLASAGTPVKTSDENFGRVARVYIKTLRDRAISPSLQDQMYTAVPCRQVISMDTSHSPFLSTPEELADHLLSLSADRT